MEWRIATWDNVAHVLDNLCEQHLDEYSKLGFPGEAFGLRLIHFMMGGETYCLWFDGEPQAFLSIGEDHGINVTWLGATEAAMNRGSGPIKAGRKKLREAADKFGPITSFITSKHPDVDRWMRLFGFKMQEQCEGTRIYVFV